MAHRTPAARGTGRQGADPLRLPGAPVRDGRPVRPDGDRDRLPREAPADQDRRGHHGAHPPAHGWLLADPARPVGEALLDQRTLAGVGNIYKAETLFLRGVDPWRPVGEVAGLAALIGLAQRLLEANKERAGIITTGSTRRGEETWVYGRAGRPCRRCGTPVRSADQGRDPEGRITYWCPSCQS